MIKRCPDSTYLGIARLNGYRWIINERGYANVVEKKKGKDVVWGLVYSLTDTDEEKLDVNEGVPKSYTKEDLKVDFWPARKGKKPETVEEPEKVEMLVYIDRERTEKDGPKKEVCIGSPRLLCELLC